MRRIRRHLTFANVASAIALFVALGGGTAVALSGSNTVFTDDIANDTFNSPTEGQGGLVAADLRPNSVGGSEVADNSLRASDLGVNLRNARQPTTGPGSTCGTTTDFSVCAFMSLNLPRAQRLLLLGSGEWTGGTAQQDVPNRGICRVGVGQEFLGHRSFGELFSTASDPYNFSINTVTSVLPAGFYELALECRKTSGNMRGVKNAEFSVVAVGDDT